MSYGNGDANMSIKQSGKDFVLEVCQESVRNRCSRLESQCRYAHPPPNIHIADGKVQCCADFLKVIDYHVDHDYTYWVLL